MDARTTVRRVVKPVLWLAGLAPAAILLVRGFTDELGANPVEEITHWTGRASLVILLVALAVTPLRRLTGWNALVQTRRLIGLFAFFYAFLHVLTYVAIDQFFAFGDIIADIAERPYITVGTVAFLILAALALTSTRGWIRRLGRRWQKLHRLVYLAAALGVLHFFWKMSSKSDVRDPLIFAAVLALLLLLRLPKRTSG